ncbi:hypothetical protein CA85_26000 [Allorhodopirellula solitaria]|uniref:DUF1269 domain-containing protein n=2 Tax=Allorhodopirellula solitaria TaxID=2527987 RepID=A0A5C5XUE2_9BACT|nr:hypothetical protein CA85_26000 [Allorhodopirellula solitaria]
MANLVVVGYDDQFKAEEVRLALVKMQQDYLVDLEDAVVAVKTEKGKVKLHQPVSLTGTGAAYGGLWGTLIGCFFFNPFAPLIGAAVGAATGGLSGALSDIGIEDGFMKQIAGQLEPGRSALFVLVRKATPDKVLEELKGYGGTILQTSLTHEQEEKLQSALDKAKS